MLSFNVSTTIGERHGFNYQLSLFYARCEMYSILPEYLRLISYRVYNYSVFLSSIEDYC